MQLVLCPVIFICGPLKTSGRRIRPGILNQETIVAASGSETERYKAPALSKGLDILEALADSGTGYTQAELSKRLGRSQSEIYRMLHVLQQREYLDIGADDRYRLTTKLFEVAHRYPPVRRLTAIAGEMLLDLVNEVDQSAHLAILHGGQVLVLAQIDCPGNTITTVRLGARFPIFNSASGRPLAAYMDEKELSHLLSIAGEADEEDKETFLSDIKEVRELGYCEGTSRLIAGVTNLSAPVFDYTGKVIAAVTIPFITRLSGTETMDVTQTRERLVQTCQEMSRRMGAGVGGADRSPG